MTLWYNKCEGKGGIIVKKIIPIQGLRLTNSIKAPLKI